MTLGMIGLTAVAVFGLLFGLCRLLAGKINNYGIIDILWSYSFAVLVLGLAGAEDGWVVRRAWLAAMVCVWSLRLGTHVAIRVIGHHPREDPRYGQLREEWAKNFATKMTGFFLLQAGSVVFLGIPFFAALRNATPRFSGWEIAGSALWLIGVSGEALADRQLARFKRHPTNQARICDTGLWRYSRHPNYFFEWTVWMGYFVFACGSTGGWLGIVSPACILYFLLGVTGIPMTEKQSLRSKGDAYRRYQAQTSAFVPLPRKSP